MTASLVTATAIGSILIWFAAAYLQRARAVRERGISLERAGGLPAIVPYFVWLPYVVIALRPGPELALPQPVRQAGLVLTVGGIAFALWALRTMGRHYDVEVEIHRGHELVRSGPFAIVRHPVYAGLALHFVGTCLATGNLVLIAGTLAGAIPAFCIRARAEERLLRREFGPAYEEYAREVPMLLPSTARRSR
jgi:protein-S-isoprenylcysteine O-methyltransferase Ste14